MQSRFPIALPGPGEASVYVLRGWVVLSSAGQSSEGRDGDPLIVPDAPHSV